MITDALVDLAYEAMTDELEYWRIIGPDAQGVYVAIRDPEIQLKMKASAIIVPSEQIKPPTEVQKAFRMRDKPHAVACLQWHALRAALAAVKRELDPSSSEIGDASTGEVNEPTTVANDEEDTK